MAGKVFTGAIGVVRVQGNDTPIGLLKSIRCNENYTRVSVGGVGTIYDKEVPVTKFNGSMSVDYALIDWSAAHRIAGVKRVGVATKEEFENNLTMDDVGFYVTVYKKTSDVLDANGNIKVKEKPSFQVNGVFMDSEGFGLSEGGVGDHSQSFRYLQPISFAEKLDTSGNDVSAFKHYVE